MGKAYRSFKVSELKIFTMTSEYLAAAPRPRLGETELGGGREASDHLKKAPDQPNLTNHIHHLHLQLP